MIYCIPYVDREVGMHVAYVVPSHVTDRPYVNIMN